MIAMQESSGRHMGRVPPKIVNPTSESRSSPFMTQKEAAAPKTETMMKKVGMGAVKATVGFGVGFLAGYYGSYLDFDQRSSMFDAALTYVSLGTGAITAAWCMTLDNFTEMKADVRAFVKAGFIPGFVACSIFGHEVAAIVVGSVAGTIGIIRRRIKE